ncbi:TetR family transcriptional regulator [Marmoricola endophyticus]|uniref:TetR family transcriptional regulator n=1 Tax=Marmoricola endophyticus TaxID=2040280 RepID=A0A917F887_9ACTN|nr:TetR/AcrR family transcriptional regulator [Marmoricola endophyticus]GGF57280.1 TetR family transcriptional regulator [Marmoricola endophyticus]
MPRRPTEKLLEVAKSGTRRQRFSSGSTRRALIAAGEELFTAQGYAGTSLDAVVARAEVTKGALYHHFSGKQALFESVFESVEERAKVRILEALRTDTDPFDRARHGLRAFLEEVRDPAYSRVVVQQGPAVLGWERFREREEASAFGIVLEAVRGVLESSLTELDDAMVETFSRIFFGAMTSAGESVSQAEDQALAAARVESAIGFILTGLATLSEQGLHVPDPYDLARADGPEAQPE